MQLAGRFLGSSFSGPGARALTNGEAPRTDHQDQQEPTTRGGSSSAGGALRLGDGWRQSLCSAASRRKSGCVNLVGEESEEGNSWLGWRPARNQLCHAVRLGFLSALLSQLLPTVPPRPHPPTPHRLLLQPHLQSSAQISTAAALKSHLVSLLVKEQVSD